MNNVTRRTQKIFWLLIFAIVANVLVFALMFNKKTPFGPSPFPSGWPKIPPTSDNLKADEIKNFSSEADFKEYLEASAKLSNGYGGGFGVSTMMNEAILAPGAITKNATDAMGGGGAPDRVSGTNVQVIGIDEPDIVKTDGKEIYFSGIQRYYPSPMMRGNTGGGISSEEQKMIAPYPYPTPQAETKIIKAFPPADLAVEGKIDKQGDLLLDNNILVVFPTLGYYGNAQEITAYDVSKPKSPEKKWTIKLESNTSIVTSRLHNGKIYLLTRNNIDQNRPCPLKPLSVGDSPISIPCQEIYHPVLPISVDTTFVASLVNPADGKVEKNVSFVGSSGTTVIYASENAIYATYTYSESIVKFYSGFIKENSGFFPAWLAEKIGKLEGYDISETSKMMELTMILQKYESSLGDDERLKLDNEMKNRMSDYYKAHSRELEKTGIVKINTDSFAIIASGAVPGHLLNNFAMDEYKGNLRVASTIGSRWGIFNGLGSGESVSDVTVLDKDLNFVGSVRDLGKTEQIYSVRFIEDKGYMVTFRQTDPFYVLDLADPKNPAMAGELKIPGYSSYLHPLDATRILGIGQEGSQVKISLFDVTDKNNPVELDKYLLDEYWSEVSNNYHAFLLDAKHKIFFLPGSKGGYVFSYNNISKSSRGAPSDIFPKESYALELKKAVSQNSVKRAVYLNDYLYVIGEDKITVLNESDWEKVKDLDLR